LPENERFLSFDRLWETYEDEAALPNNDYIYDYFPAPTALIAKLKKLSFDAYKACGGKGYTRIDIRQDAATGKLYMIEANAQCGLSEDSDYTSIGAILKVSNVTFTEIIAEILKDALRRSVDTTTSIKVKKVTAKKPTSKKAVTAKIK
jgi:D-alanine-D-alanine ligase